MSAEGAVRHRPPTWQLIVALLAGVLLVGGVVASIWVALRGTDWLKSYVIAEAKKSGVELVIHGFEWGLDGVEMTDPELRLEGVTTVEGRATRFDVSVLVDLDGVHITRLALSGLQLDVTGSLALVALELGQWTSLHPEAYALGLTVGEIEGRWRPDANAPFWLVAHGGSITPHEVGGELRAQEVVVAGQSLGAVAGSWGSSDTVVAVGLGEPDLGAAPIRATIHHDSGHRSADLSLAPTTLAQLESSLGVDLPDEDITLSARAHLAFADDPFAGPVQGWLQLKLDGFIPPHPPELDGFVFGESTELETQLHVDEARQKVLLEGTRVAAGKFVLEGQGAVLREGADARLVMELAGKLPCSSLAGAAVESRLGKVFGPWLRRATEKMVQGHVSITVKLDAHTSHLDEMRVARVIGMGCGLKPLKIPGLGDFALPELSQLPKLGEVLGSPTSPFPSWPRPAQGGGTQSTGGGNDSWPPLPSTLPLPRIGGSTKPRQLEDQRSVPQPASPRPAAPSSVDPERAPGAPATGTRTDSASAKPAPAASEPTPAASEPSAPTDSP